ncbi:MAG: hypothetical protein JRI97_08345 [Deltaproteobacteria bacterium]|nr:hypothetical protein [Deltaproteobacteria bacterium]
MSLAALTMSSAAPSEGIQIGGNSARVTARVTDDNGDLAPNGTIVTFTTTAGAMTSIAAMAPGTATSVQAATINGLASALVWSPDVPGTATVRATSGGMSDSVEVAFVPGPPDDMRITISPPSVDSDGESTTTITIEIRDSLGIPVGDGADIYFQVDRGALNKLSAKTSGGFVDVTYTAPTGGTADTFTATAYNGLEKVYSIPLIGAALGSLELSADKTQLPAGGSDTATIEALVTLQGGGPVSGALVNFKITGAVDQTGNPITDSSQWGTLSQASATTNSNGVASVTLSPGPVAATITLFAECQNEVNDILTFDFKSGSVAINIVPNSILATGTETTDISAAVSPTGAGGASQLTLTLSDGSMGDLADTILTLNAQGEASTSFTGGTRGGTVRITGTWTGPAGDTITGFADLAIQYPPAFIAVAENSPTPATINVRGTGTATTSLITFDVQDGQDVTGGVADGYRIDFEIVDGPDAGEAISPLYAYTKGGQVSTLLNSGFKSGPVTIKASYFNDRTVNAVASLVINAGPPVGEEFSIAAGYRNISGLWMTGLQDPITSYVGDFWGNAIPDGTSIFFATNNTGGLFDPGNAATEGGAATNILLSTDNPAPVQGFVSVTTAANNGGRTTRVTDISMIPGTDIMYLSTNGGGVYKSLDSGASWKNISTSSENLQQNWIEPYVNTVAVDPEDPNTVFAGTGFAGEGRVYRSFDGGASWNSGDPEEIWGMDQYSSAVNVILCDGASDYMWVGTDLDGLYIYPNCLQTRSWDMTVLRPTTGLGVGTRVTCLVQVGGSGATAVLYAGTDQGVYLSTDGGANWTRVVDALGKRFIGDNITAIEVYNGGTPLVTADDVIYVGTLDAGVWEYDSAASSWTNYSSGMGEGIDVTMPKLTKDSVGNGYIDNLHILPDGKTESWTMTCIAESANGGTFALTGDVSGPQANASVGVPYSTGNMLGFTIVDGEVDFKVGDTFTFRTIRDHGKEIKDLCLDKSRNKLYALTYFWGALPHAVGNVYVHDLNADGTFAAGDWSEVNNNLPQYEPPDDTNLYAFHVMKINSTADTLFVGGEGIHLYNAVHAPAVAGGSDFAADDIRWKPSERGLSNKIFARQPVLFSGKTSMDIYQTVTPMIGSASGISYSYDRYDLEILCQDKYGNPPIQGSELIMTTWTAKSADEFEITITKIFGWGDSYTSRGTYRDGPEYFSYAVHGRPVGEPLYWPITVSFNVGPAPFYPAPIYQKVELKYVPANNAEAPGSSGGQEESVLFEP